MKIASFELADIRLLENNLNQKIQEELLTIFQHKYSRKPRKQFFSLLMPWTEPNFNLLTSFDANIRLIAQAMTNQNGGGMPMAFFNNETIANVTAIETDNQARQLSQLNENIKNGEMLIMELTEVRQPRDQHYNSAQITLNFTDVNQIPRELLYKINGIAMFGIH